MDDNPVNFDTLQDYLANMLSRHPGLSMRQASLQAGLNENSVQQILKATHFTPKPQTIKALADQWGTQEDYVNMLRLAGHSLPVHAELDSLSTEKQYAIRLLAQDEIPDSVAESIAAGLEVFLKHHKEE